MACLLQKTRSVFVSVASVRRRVSTADHFDQFLQTGVFHGDETVLSIMSLTDEEWVPFSLFVDQYSVDWESYFADTMYVAYFQEHDKRHWHPTTPRFQSDDLRLQTSCCSLLGKMGCL